MRNVSKLSMEIFDKFLVVLCDKPNLFTKDMLKLMADVYSTKDTEDKLANMKLINQILHLSEDNRAKFKDKDNLYLLDIWQIVNDETKIIIKNKIEALLETSFSHTTYWYFVMNDIVDYKIHFQEYINYITTQNEIKSDKSPFFYDLTGKSNILIDEINYEFINFIRLAYKCGELPSDSLCEIFKDKPEYVKFYLNPGGYNYELFDSKWIAYTRDSIVHQALNKIPRLKIAVAEFIKAHNIKEVTDLYIKYYF